MRRHEVALIAAALALVTLTACNRLTFIRPNTKKYKIEQVRKPPQVHDSAATQQRMDALDALQLASERLAQGNLDEAERAAERALAQDGRNITAMTILGVIEQQRGSLPRAGAWFRQASEQKTSGPAEWGNYGSWLCESNRAQEGLALLDRSLQYPDQINVPAMRANAGKCALALGQSQRAETDLRAALVADPNNAVALDGMAQLMFASGQMMEARAFSERRLGAGAVTADMLLRAASIETRLGDTAAAARYQQRLRQEFPNATPKPKGQ